jgi:hypothetical protein
MSKEIKGRWIIVAVFILYLLYLIIKYTPTSILICILEVIFIITSIGIIIYLQILLQRNRAGLDDLKVRNMTEGYVNFGSNSVFINGVFNVDDLEKQYNRYKWFYVGFYWDLLVSAAKYVDKVLTIKL